MLIDTLRRDEFASLSDAAAAAYLAETVEISRDSSLNTIRRVHQVLTSDDDLRLVLGTIDAVAAQDPIVKGFATTIQTTGVDFSAARVQSMVGVLASVGNWPDSVTDAVRSIGVQMGPRWQREGLPSAPSASDIAQARDWIKALDLRDSITAAVNGEQSLAQIKTLVAATIGGW